MKKTDLQSLVQECIAEVLAEKQTNEGYSEFQRVDKGEKDVDAKDKGEEDVYGAGYAAGERAAKAKYKKLAEAYKALKEEGFGIGPRGLEVSDKDVYEAKVNPAGIGKGIDVEVAQEYAESFDDDDILSDFKSTFSTTNKITKSAFVNFFEQYIDDMSELKDINNAWKALVSGEGLYEARFKKGEDIGKPGPGFKKVAKAAKKQYGSKEAGQKVAGAILKKVLKK